jgi:hypothetical protein
MDLLSYSKWWDYERARDDMFEATDTDFAPWYVAHTNDKKRGRLNVISHLLSLVPYKPLKLPEVELPRRQKKPANLQAGPAVREIPTPYS